MPNNLLALPAHDGSALYVSEAAPALGETVSVFIRAPAAAGRAAASTCERRRTASRASPRPPWTAVERGRDVVAGRRRGPQPGHRVPVPARHRAGPRWLNAAGLVGHDVPDATDFRLRRLRPAAGLGGRRGGVPDLPRPVRPLGRRRGPAAARLGRSRATGTPRSSAAGRETPYQFYGGDLDGITEHLDHIERARRQHRLPDADLPGPVQPPLRRGRRSTGWIRCSAGDEALARLAEAVARARAAACSATSPPTTAATPTRGSEAAPAGGGRARDVLLRRSATTTSRGWACKSLPKLNWASPELRRRFVDGPDSVAQRWLRPPYGLDGWRVDVANMTGRRGADQSTPSRWPGCCGGRVAGARGDGAAGGRARPRRHAPTSTATAGTATMNYAGFTRPLWSWLRADDAGAARLPGRARRRAAPGRGRVGGDHAGVRRPHLVAHARPLVDAARARTTPPGSGPSSATRPGSRWRSGCW